MTGASVTETPPESSRFIVGIDLGTTNSAAAYVDTTLERWELHTLTMVQLTAAGQVEPRDTLPSFHYEPLAGELPAGALRLPWGSAEPTYAVGVFARDQGALSPARLIASAKSWLCHAGIDRTADLLPWRGAADVRRISPVEASARYLRHIHDVWNARFPDYRLAEQDVVITLPASFDEIARELTVRAAQRAGLPRVVLIEEPQAAFYSWIAAHAGHWERLVAPGQKILVCDIGGGTSDFTLIRVRRGAGGKVEFHRAAVGEHLILGGDNLDLALAHHVEQRLLATGAELDVRQWGVLVRLCRQAKETLLGDAPPERLMLQIPGAGTRLIGGGRTIELTQAEAQRVLVEGFFPLVELEDKPANRQSGFQEFGLPYAPDAAVTRYLAAFLTAHRHVAESDQPAQIAGQSPAQDPARPDIVLFNGGLFAAPALRQRLLDQLQAWFSAGDAGWQPLVLQNDRLDLAVARGAAYYGMVRRGRGVSIAAGLARTYYVGVEHESGGVLCLVPAGAEPGQTFDLAGRKFALRMSQPVEFPLFTSSTRLSDAPGDLIPQDREQLTPMPPIQTVLRSNSKGEAATAVVELHARLTEIGTLEMWCAEVGGRRSWKLQFDVRSATRTDIAAHAAIGEREGIFDETVWDRCRELIEATFGPHASASPEGLLKRLGAVSGLDRQEWPTTLLRRFWETLIENEPGRHRSPAHEARWLNLLGYALRPGYGLAADDWRVAETRRCIAGRLVHHTTTCLAEWWVCWRRIAGGLSASQQQGLAEPLLNVIRQMRRQSAAGKKLAVEVSSSTHEAGEIWRFVGSLELLPASVKIELGQCLLAQLADPRSAAVHNAMFWALGRIGARKPLYAPLDAVLPPDLAASWVSRLMACAGDQAAAHLAIMQLARKTGDRYRDLPAALREATLAWLDARQVPAHFIELVRNGGVLDAAEQALVFGESLPRGLRIV